VSVFIALIIILLKLHRRHRILYYTLYHVYNYWNFVRCTASAAARETLTKNSTRVSVTRKKGC